jgi:hypothetical protein
LHEIFRLSAREKLVLGATRPGRYLVEYRFNTEREVKFTTDEAGLRHATSWLDSRIKTDLGRTPKFRNYIYFDRPDFLLSERGASFRQSANKPSYCLKYPIGQQSVFMLRREVFTKCPDYYLDVRNPLHRNVPVIRWMAAFLGEDDIPLVRRLAGFAPQIRIECQRVYRIIPRPDDINWMIGIALDRVKAFRPNEADPFASWCEVELEPSTIFEDNLDAAQKLVDGLAAEGMKITAKNKYSYAVDILSTRNHGAHR